MKAEIEKALPQVRVELVEGSNGIFEVKKDGKLVFSKHKVNRFPRQGEIIPLLQ